MFLLVALIMSPKLPLLEIHDNILEKIERHVQTDEGVRNGIRYFFHGDIRPKLEAVIGPYDSNVCFKHLDKHIEELVLMFPFFTKYKWIIDEIKKCSNDTSLTGTPDFSGLFDDLEPDLVRLENTHPKMKEVASELLNGRDLYTEFRPPKEDFFLKRLMEIYESPEVEMLLEEADKHHFDMRRIFKLVMLFFHDVNLDQMKEDD